MDWPPALSSTAPPRLVTRAGIAAAGAFGVGTLLFSASTYLTRVNSGLHESGDAIAATNRRLALVGYGRLNATCSGSQEDLRPCNPTACSSFTPPEDCLWGPWSTWAACDCGGTQQRYRAVHRESAYGGKPCYGPEKELRHCNSTCDTVGRVDCTLTTWDAWSTCTRTCQTGQQYRSREVEMRQRNGGAMCSGSLHETQTCSTQDCPNSVAVNCQWGFWTPWSTCTVTCGFGEHRRSRSVRVSPSNGGKLCEPLTSAEVTRCGKPCNGGTSKNCKWSQWAEWSVCSKSCGGGDQRRARGIERPASEGGAGCLGRFEDYRDCATAACTGIGQDCALGDWSEWSLCSAHCNGHHQRTRTVVVMARAGGRPCSGSTEEMTPCNTDRSMCETKIADCLYSVWATWSPCSRSCGGGDSQRKRNIMTHATGRGHQCTGDLQVMRRCSTQPCQGYELHDCQWSPWSLWSVCSATCGGGQKRRHRTIVIEAENGGKPCNSGSGVEVKPCHTEHCSEKWYICEWLTWGQWSQCLRTGVVVECGGGQRQRTRTSKRRKEDVDSATMQKLNGHRRLLAGGTEHVSCKQIQDEVRPCASHTCPKREPRDCMWAAWSAWSACPCNGLQARHRVILKFARGGGAGCEGSEVQSQPCTPHCHQMPSIDCQYSTWTAWSACPVTCGGGHDHGFLVRYRNVMENAEGTGRECDRRTIQKQPCNVDACPPKQDCLWGDWAQPSACSKTCGGGEMFRTRIIIRQVKNGGKVCEAKDNVRVNACNTQPCPTQARDCEFSIWNNWQTCTMTCGGGLQHRSRTVLIAATNAGIQCEGKLQEFRKCGTIPCWTIKKVDCAWNAWSDWGACTSLCNGHHERNRAFARSSIAGGTPCDGPEREVYPCNLNSPACKSEGSRDCEFGQWNDWTPCSKPCSGGQYFRDREVEVHARNFGKPCNGTLQQSQACNTRPCPNSSRIDCQWGGWSQWSACTKSCMGGQASRIRGIDREASDGGHACKARASMEMRPCNVGPCGRPQEFCTWSAWTEWEACSMTCGGGQQQRAHQKQWAQDTLFGQGATPVAQRRLVGPPALGISSNCAGAQHELRPCNIVPCDPVTTASTCLWGSWADWTACSCEGLQERDRGIAQHASGGGLACVGPARLTRRCSPHCDQETVDCKFSGWMEWGQCSATCGGGQTTRARLVQRHAQGYGGGCHGMLSEVQACGTQPCSPAQDCHYTSWSQWSMCSVSCGGGQAARKRTVIEPKAGGQMCEAAPLAELKGCGTAACSGSPSKDCQWAQWTPWSSCSATCGSGRHARHRVIQYPVQPGGKPCSGVFQEYNTCKVTSCRTVSVDCRLWPWSEWSRCFQACHGHAERIRDIEVYAVSRGKPCKGPLRQMKPCGSFNGSACLNVRTPVGSHDCAMSNWAAWSACSHTCDVGQRFSTRRVTRQASILGRACSGGLRRTLPCDLAPCDATGPVNCKWDDWGPMSSCSAVCGGGERTRRRAIAREASHGGQNCLPNDSLQIFPCNTQPCTSEQCTWSPWTTWSPCSVTCGGGQTKRHRYLSWVRARMNYAFGATGLDEQLRRDGIALSPLEAFDNSLHTFVAAHGPALCALAMIGSASILLFVISGTVDLVTRATASRRKTAHHYIGVATEEPWALGVDDMESPAITAHADDFL